LLDWQARRPAFIEGWASRRTRDSVKMKTHSEEVEEILSAGATASFEQKAIALAEIDDGKLPHPWLRHWAEMDRSLVYSKPR
jgi:hypothetical protein